MTEGTHGFLFLDEKQGWTNKNQFFIVFIFGIMLRHKLHLDWREPWFDEDRRNSVWSGVSFCTRIIPVYTLYTPYFQIPRW